MKQLYLLFFTIFTITSYAQIGIGTTTPNAALEIASTTNGVVIPRIALTSKLTQAPVVNPQGGALPEGTLIWNTATAGIAPNNVTPGFYFWSASSWNVIAGNPTRDWSLSGNPIAALSTDFLGTTTNEDLRIRTNNNVRFTFTNNGRLIAHNDGTAALPMYSWNTDPDTGMYRIAANTMAFSTNGAERMRLLANGQVSVNTPAPIAGDFFSVTSNTANRYAINAYNTFADGSAIYAINTNATNGYSAIEGVSNAVDGGGVYGINMSPAPGIRVGVRGIGNSGFYNRQIGIQGSYNADAWGIGVIGIGYGGGIPAGNNDVAVMGWVGNNSDFSGYFNGNHAVVNGTKSASVGTSKGNQLLYVTESPEVWFEDIGRAKLTAGSVTVKLDPLFMETIFVDDNHPISVFLQEEGESNGLYVIVGKDGFTVKEKNGGVSNISFSYRIMAKRLHFQDHRFGNDAIWGAGDTRLYNQYAPPPPVDYYEKVKFQEEARKNYKPSPKPPGFTEINSRRPLSKPISSLEKE